MLVGPSRAQIPVFQLASLCQLACSATRIPPRPSLRNLCAECGLPLNTSSATLSSGASHCPAQTAGGGGGRRHLSEFLGEGADHAAYEMVHRKSAMLSSLALVFGEVSLVRSHSVMAARS